MRIVALACIVDNTRPRPNPIPDRKLNARQLRQAPLDPGAILGGADHMHIRPGVDRELAP